MRLGAALAIALVAGLAGILVALADCGNTAAAQLTGQWQFHAVRTYQGPAVSSALQAQQNKTSSGTAFFTSTCTGPGSCSVAMGNTPTSAATQGYIDNATNIYQPPGQPMVQSGSTMTVTFPPGGFGGPGLPPCRPPQNSYTLSIHIGAASQTPSGTWQPLYITGSEVSLADWTCSGSTGVAAAFAHVDFVGVPAGHSFPASLAALCSPPSKPALASTPAPAPPANPQQSTISTALTTPSGAFGSLGHALANALITLGIVLFITFPATLFNKTFEENYDEIRDIVRRRFGWAARFSASLARSDSRGRDAAVFALVVLVGAILGGLNDPHFGVSGSSLMTLVAVILAVLFGVGVTTLVGYAYRRRRRLEVSARLHALPAGLVVAAACVLVSRLTSFQPGYLYGVICGVAFAGALQRADTGRLVAISSLTTLGVAVVAWLVWVPVKGAAAVPGASPAAVVAGDFLAAVFVGGLVGSVIGLVPLRFLPGGELAAWSRAAWGALFGLAVFGLLQVMLRPQSSSVHTGTTAVVTAAVLFVVFGAASVGFRVYFGRRRRTRSPAAA